MNFLSLYQEQINKYLTNAQVQTWNILVWLIQINKEVKIERLAACFPLPILYESRRKHLQRFLKLSSLSIPLIWFPIIKLVIEQEFKLSTRLIITLDRTQWKDNNVFVVAVIWKKHALPIYWVLLEKRGSSNLKEQQALIRPVLKLLNNYELVVIGDREFHSVELASWLKTQGKDRKKALKFAFRQKQGTYIKIGRNQEHPLKNIS